MQLRFGQLGTTVIGQPVHNSAGTNFSLLNIPRINKISKALIHTRLIDIDFLSKLRSGYNGAAREGNLAQYFFVADLFRAAHMHQLPFTDVKTTEK